MRRALLAWIAVVLAALPVAWGLARAGYGWPLRSPWADVGWIAVTAAAEEIVFRGGLQAWLLQRQALAQRIAGLSAANVIASIAFAALHVAAHPLVVALGMFPVSLLLGLAFEAGGRRLALPVALHLWFNLALYGASRIAV